MSTLDVNECYQILGVDSTSTPKEIKQAVRDIVAPGRDLGHVDH